MAGGFGQAERAAALEAMASHELDLLVVGGGITGCGLARDAALRGLSVGLVEREDFAAGTSSRSSKIVHGGIRYLRYGWLATVRESARERSVLRRVGPHLLHPMPFVYPLYRGQSKLVFRAGFVLFDLLAGVTGADRHRFLSEEEVRERVPGLRDDLKGGVVYGEYITDDARLTLENARSAANHGALVANHAPALSFLTHHVEGEERVVGARVRDALGGMEHEVRARVVVNATGPWAERLLEASGFRSEKHILPSKGIHLLFRADRLPLASATHIKAPSGREGLAMRRGPYVYVGTSDVEYGGPLESPAADPAAIEEVLRMSEGCFPGLALTADDVVATWAGVRPLVAEPGKSPRDTPRKDVIWRTRPGVLTVGGGKLTTYRRMGQRIMQRVAEELGRALPGEERTGEVPLPGAPAGQDIEAWREGLLEALRARGVAEPTAERIAWLYGTEARALLGYLEEDPAWGRPLGPATPALRGEVRLAVEQGMALTLEDILDRRMALLLFSDDQGRAAAREAAAIAGRLLGWSDETRAAQEGAYRAVADRHGPGGAAD